MHPPAGRTQGSEGRTDRCMIARRAGSWPVVWGYYYTDRQTQEREGGVPTPSRSDGGPSKPPDFFRPAVMTPRHDHDFCSAEATIGIGIDADTGTQDGERFYSAHYLRLHPEWRLGVFAETKEKTEQPGRRIDLITKLIQDNGRILVGGQQRRGATHPVRRRRHHRSRLLHRET